MSQYWPEWHAAYQDTGPHGHNAETSETSKRAMKAISAMGVLLLALFLTIFHLAVR
jgi:hypothetical protein